MRFQQHSYTDNVMSLYHIFTKYIISTTVKIIYKIVTWKFSVKSGALQLNIILFFTRNKDTRNKLYR